MAYAGCPTLFSADAKVATITAIAATFTSSISPPSFNAASLSTAVIAATITLVSATVPAVTSGYPLRTGRWDRRQAPQSVQSLDRLPA